MFATATAAVAQTVLTPPQTFVWTWNGPDKNVLNQGGDVIKNTQAAIQLGKALFWDQQAGSDGVACASCHFHAGADTRRTNQLNPGFKDISFGPNGDFQFGSIRSDTGAVLPGNMRSGAKADSNYTLQPSDMPFHKLSDESNRDSAIESTTNDRVSSQGAFDSSFIRMNPYKEHCKKPDSSIFHAGRGAARQVEPRNTPTMINAVFFHRNFWDGRANNLFNGVGVFGMRDYADPTKRLLTFAGSTPQAQLLAIENASLASQSVGPPLSDLESSCSGRTFPDLGRKMINAQPLKGQDVSETDSVLGGLVHASGKGLSGQYTDLIKRAFQEKWWNTPGKYSISPGGIWNKDNSAKGYTQMENNFSMFWGLAVMLYEASLISNQSEFDRLQQTGDLVMRTSFGGPPGPGNCNMSATLLADPDKALLQRGCTIFSRNVTVATPPDGIRGGGCFICHNATGGGTNRVSDNTAAPARSFQPLLAEGTTSLPLTEYGATPSTTVPPTDETFSILLNPVPDVDQVRSLRDQGFAGIGLRPVFSDMMSGGADPYCDNATPPNCGPLAYGRQYWQYLDALAAGAPNPENKLLDPVLRRLVLGPAGPYAGGAVRPARPFDPPLATPLPPNGAPFAKLEDDGSSKAPILRNVALTPPYFSWGGYPSLRQVLKTYNRGMNRRVIDAANDPDNASGPSGTTHCITGDDSGTGADGNRTLAQLASTGSDCGTNTTGAIQRLGLLDCDQQANRGSAGSGKPCWDGTGVIGSGQKTSANDDLAALERFLKSLTDRRVQCSAAPFDHPSLSVNDGHIPLTPPLKDKRAKDIVHVLPAVGANGYDPTKPGYCIPNAGDLFAPGMQATSGGPLAPPISP
ncbi:hypothetical protein LG047_03780 [Methylocystis sp. WRRC1]|uniref:cytochrome c peroxidase n=1 Tax=Methylocystis sp. WRRC1 TaxID=1732014 RepID=UPI001D15D4B5|nr:cytochrome c peroxidase [Methylocystis sp. WRRC1]MCC3244448.1 hypothetical protein [Methylocystis sp. WRRC1]